MPGLEPADHRQRAEQRGSEGQQEGLGRVCQGAGCAPLPSTHDMSENGVPTMT